MSLVNAELRKIRTTATWWIFGLVMLPLWALALLVNWGTSNLTTNADQTGLNADQAEQVKVAGEAVNVAANLYTSGQFFGVLIVMVLGAIVVTNEFFHQTATTTFLTTPRRESVLVAKLIASALLGLVFWVLIRSQIAATLTLAIGYLVGTSGASIIFALLTDKVADWFSKLEVLVPTTASSLMISGTELPGSPPRWVGAVVLVGYAVVAGVLGTAIMRRRDIT